jgi:cytochrome c-type biogenesis protein CcmH
MLLLALAFVLVPLWRGRPAPVATDADSAANLAVFRSQKHEIEEEFARRVIGAAERDAAIAELSQRLLDEVSGDGGQTSKPAAASRSWLLMAALAVLIPSVAIVIYAVLGSPKALDPANRMTAGPAPAQAHPEGAEPQISDKQILAMVDTLAQKMRENPSDPKGWVLLARSQGALGRYPAAIEAFEQAARLLPNDAQLFADYADTMVLAQDGRFDGKPLTLIRQTLKLDPNNMKGLALAGTAELRLGNRDASIKHWEKLKSLVAPNSDDMRQVDAILAEIRSGKAPVEPATQPVQAVAPPQASQAAPTVVAKSAAGKSITGSVTLAPELASKLAATDTLFVFARAKEGPRMPLAVWRIPVPKAGEFPKAFELTDGMAMAPGLNLSAFADVVIEARVSKSGNAQLQPGDLSGTSDAVKPGAANVSVTISRVAP